ncbi:uncharacterized protein LOC141559001 [Sminthopsis crassicaudata]|uniref:uncharacterized protein LOC141559001 n=1 Tax=Sminthopsis crassicaudata TaxID=9301 RepID=UPI003D68DDE1
MAVYSRDFPGLGSSFVGEVVFPCARAVADSVSGRPVGYTRELSATRSKLPKSLSCQNLLAPGPQAPQTGSQGRLFLLLQFQAAARRIKVLVRRAENLRSSGRLRGHREHSVVIGLYQAGQLLDSRETRAVGGMQPGVECPLPLQPPSRRPSGAETLPAVYCQAEPPANPNCHPGLGPNRSGSLSGWPGTLAGHVPAQPPGIFPVAPPSAQASRTLPGQQPLELGQETADAEGLRADAGRSMQG